MTRGDIYAAATRGLLNRCAAGALICGVLGQASAQTVDAVMLCKWDNGGTDHFRITPEALLVWKAPEWKWDRMKCWRQRENVIDPLETVTDEICRVSLSDAYYTFENSYQYHLEAAYMGFRSESYRFSRSDGRLSVARKHNFFARGKEPDRSMMVSQATCNRAPDPALSPRPEPVF